MTTLGRVGVRAMPPQCGEHDIGRIELEPMPVQISLLACMLDALSPDMKEIEKGTQAPRTNLAHKSWSKLRLRALQFIELPLDTIVIPPRMFIRAWMLHTVILPEGLCSIGRSSFECCYKLNNITFPSTLASIEEYVFFGCRSLSSVTFLGGCKRIGMGAFMDCSSLRSITIPDTIESIGVDAFAQCTSLEILYIPTTYPFTPPWIPEYGYAAETTLFTKTVWKRHPRRMNVRY